ncbi:hypothetical protein ACLOJK_038431 [Asimina triloba]
MLQSRCIDHTLSQSRKSLEYLILNSPLGLAAKHFHFLAPSLGFCFFASLRMSACKSLLLTSIPSCKVIARRGGRRRKPSSLYLQSFPSIRPSCLFQSLHFTHPHPHLFIPFSAFSHEAAAAALHQQTHLDADADAADDDLSKDTVEELLAKADGVSGLMNMERAPETDGFPARRGRWFPYLDMFRSGTTWLTSRQVIDALDPYILDVRKERIRRVVQNRSYSVSLVVEGLTDFGNVSAAFRSADALGLQSVHVVSCDSSKRCIEVKKAF